MNTNITFKEHLNVMSDVVSRTNEDGTVVVMKMTEDDFFYKINGVAARLWLSILNNNAQLDTIIESLAQEYDVSIERLKEDSGPFLDRIIELKLVQKA